MRVFFVLVITAAMPLCMPAASGQSGAAKPCAGCSQKAEPQVASTKPIPGTGESMVVGRIENLVPIGVLAALGCEKCTAEAVGWALQQGSSVEDVERTLRTLGAMQKLECFQQQFGGDAAARLDKPLAAARKILEQVAVSSGK